MNRKGKKKGQEEDKKMKAQEEEAERIKEDTIKIKEKNTDE